MNNEEYKEWEEYGFMVKRMKVDGGHIYKSGFGECFSMCFVPDIDLTRYQSHLRNAYDQGWKDGREELQSHFIKVNGTISNVANPSDTQDFKPSK